MLYAALAFALCVLISAFFIGRFFTAKARLVEKTIEETIERKLSKSPIHAELLRLREENGVMRNLLIDMVENEASLADASKIGDGTDPRRERSLSTASRGLW